jgi:hypothetical protein
MAFIQMQAAGQHNFYLFKKQIPLFLTINSYMFLLKTPLLGCSSVRNNLMKEF